MSRTAENYPANYSGRLREDFIGNLRLDFFDDDEIAALLSDLDTLDPRIRQKAFALCHSLSQAGSSLLPNTVKRMKTASTFLRPSDFGRWLGHAYDIFDHQGVGALIDFMARIDEETLKRFRPAKGLDLQRVLPVLETCLKGISGLDLKISTADESYTDTSTVYLRAFEDTYEDRDRNYLIYKFRIAHAWAQIVCGTLTPDSRTLDEFLKSRTQWHEEFFMSQPSQKSRKVINPPPHPSREGTSETIRHPDIASFFRTFPVPEMALDIYNILEGVRLVPFLEDALPGLMREVYAIKQDILMKRPSFSGLSEKTAFIEMLYQFFLRGGPPESALESALESAPESLPESALWQPEIIKALLSLKIRTGQGQSMTVLLRLYDICSRLPGDYRPAGLELLLGTIRPDKVSLVLKAGRRAQRQRRDGMITRLLEMPDFEPHKTPARLSGRHEQKPDPGKEYLLIKGRVIELDSEMLELLDERGGIPGGIIVKGADMGGAASPLRLTDLLEEAATVEEVVPESGISSGIHGGIHYDEWDYKRGGYKKKWCILHEKDSHPGHEPFVEMTVRRYSGSIRVLRKKFELLRQEPKVLRRQRDGDDIDLDAMVDALSDIHAGIPPTENLLTRYDRQERNIAVLFLLDMSGSTKGWINEAEKEALVMMAEALEALGDRYAIFGFSGMKRSNCEFFRIKGFEETYGDTVKKRISGIGPKDYTRMGPAIRHAGGILKSVEARTRLLITLSDGRPEDYDDYKGQYAIEDTRKALVETREQGIHPFCITIDRDAGNYLGHMYGESNYIVIDDVRKLPSRITEIYRRLTT
ncbi:MAG: hypothetical protein WA610_02485 [Thermodesulfovibrionales bacterium]